MLIDFLRSRSASSELLTLVLPIKHPHIRHPNLIVSFSIMTSISVETHNVENPTDVEQSDQTYQPHLINNVLGGNTIVTSPITSLDCNKIQSWKKDEGESPATNEKPRISPIRVAKSLGNQSSITASSLFWLQPGDPTAVETVLSNSYNFRETSKVDILKVSQDQKKWIPDLDDNTINTLLNETDTNGGPALLAFDRTRQIHLRSSG